MRLNVGMDGNSALSIVTRETGGRFYPGVGVILQCFNDTRCAHVLAKNGEVLCEECSEDVLAVVRAADGTADLALPEKQKKLLDSSIDMIGDAVIQTFKKHGSGHENVKAACDEMAEIVKALVKVLTKAKNVKPEETKAEEDPKAAFNKLVQDLGPF